jgi:hypothetical protein
MLFIITSIKPIHYSYIITRVSVMQPFPTRRCIHNSIAQAFDQSSAENVYFSEKNPKIS